MAQGPAEGLDASAIALVQSAVEQFVDRHGSGEPVDPLTFASGYPEPLRPRILAQCREFLAFDGLLGHQEWTADTPAAPAGRGFGDFVIQDELGRGGMGIVYLAHQRSLNRRVALKVMASGLTLSKRHVERFRREAAAAAQLRHPGIVAVHSLIEVDGTFAIAMDYVAGRNLADVLDDLRLQNRPGAVEGTLGIQPEKGYVAECALLAAQLASALAHAHQAGIVHRDLKPRNVMIDDRRQARLLDFGLAKSLADGSISMSGEITGTAHYLSPEQTLAKRVAIDHRTDVFSLGVILYELLTLQRPFDGRNLQQIVYEICFKEPVPIPGRNPNVPRDLVTICQKALEKDPQNRYQTAAEFEADLLRFLRWEPIQARPAGALSRFGKWVHRHRTESAAAAVVALVLVTIAAWSWLRTLADGRTADALLSAAEQQAAAGRFEPAITAATDALALRNDAATRARLELYREKSLRSAMQEKTDVAEAALLVQRSNQEIARDRELALLLALAAVERRPSAESRSAVLDALGGGRRALTFAGHRGQIQCARWSPDGRQLVTTGADGKVLLWDAATGALRSTLVEQGPWVVDAAFHPAGELLLTASDRVVRVWRIDDGELLATWNHDGTVDAIRFDRTGDRVLTTAYGTEQGPFVVTVWDTRSGSALADCRSHRRRVLAAALSPCGRYAASAGDRDFVRLWDAGTGRELAQLAGHTDAVRAVAFAPDGSLCATGALDGAIRLFAVPDGTTLATGRHSGGVVSIAFASDGRRLLSGARDQTARLWQLTDDRGAGSPALQELRTFVGHGSPVLHVAFDGSGQLVATAEDNGVVRLFDGSPSRTATGSELLRYEVGARVAEVTFDPDGRRILALASRERALVWEFADSRSVTTLRQPGIVPAACFDHTGDRVATAGDDERLRLWNAHDGRQLWVSDKLGNPLATVDIDPTGTLVACSTVDGRVLLHGLEDGTRRSELRAHRGRVPVTRFHATDRLLTAGADGRVLSWQLPAGTIEWELGRPHAIVAADLSPDGSLLATVEREEAVVRLWSLPACTPHGELTGHDRAVAWLRFRPDGKAVLSASADGTARITSIDGRQLSVLDAGRPLQHAVFDASGDRVLTCANGRPHEAQLWQQDGVELLRWRRHTDRLESCAFSRDGAWALSTARDGTTRIWPTDPVGMARRLELRQLSDAERRRYGLDNSLPPK